MNKRYFSKGEGKDTVDLHVHTSFGKHSLKDIIGHCFDVGLSVVALTSFNDRKIFDNYRLGADRYHAGIFSGCEIIDVNGNGAGTRAFIAKKRKSLDDGFDRVVFLRGHEIHTDKGHILGVGLREDIHMPEEGSPELEYVLDSLDAQGAIIIAPHPFVQGYWGGVGEKTLDKYKDRFHAVEWNGQCTDLVPLLDWLPPFDAMNQKKANESAMRFAHKQRIPLVATSDMHGDHYPGLRQKVLDWMMNINYGGLNQLGVGHIKVDELPIRDGDELVQDLKQKIVGGEFTEHFEVVKKREFLAWAIPVFLGGRA